jgi:membrane associated rhomboid family serine protease
MANAKRRPPVRRLRAQREPTARNTRYTVTIGFLAVCLAVHVAWLLAVRTPSGIGWMRDNFVVSWESLRAGHAWTLATAGVSHYEVSHFVANAFAIYSFGVPLEQEIGARRTATLLGASILAGNLAHLAFMALTHSNAGALGASAAAMAISGACALRWPTRRILIFFLFPLPLAAGVALFVVLDLLGLFATSASPIAHAAHLGGLVVGLGLGWRWRAL